MRGILFKPDLLAKTLDGTKTVTRRLLKPGKTHQLESVKAGERLYVKEGLRREDIDHHPAWAIYADETYVTPIVRWRWERPYLSPLHMPAECARTFIVATDDARVERLLDITEADAVAEGVEFAGATAWMGEPGWRFGGLATYGSAVSAFCVRWRALAEETGTACVRFGHEFLVRDCPDCNPLVVRLAYVLEGGR